MNWKQLNINKQNIKTATDRAVFIAVPRHSEYSGFCFWHPAKLVNTGRHSNSICIIYNDDFTFKLKKYGSGAYNKYDIIEEKEITAEQLEEAFEIMDENITAPETKTTYTTHVPKEIEPVKIDALEELKDE